MRKMLKKHSQPSMDDIMQGARLTLNIHPSQILDKQSVGNLIKDAVKEVDIATLCT